MDFRRTLRAKNRPHLIVGTLRNARKILAGKKPQVIFSPIFASQPPQLRRLVSFRQKYEFIKQNFYYTEKSIVYQSAGTIYFRLFTNALVHISLLPIVYINRLPIPLGCLFTKHGLWWWQPPADEDVIPTPARTRPTDTVNDSTKCAHWAGKKVYPLIFLFPVNSILHLVTIDSAKQSSGKFPNPANYLVNQFLSIEASVVCLFTRWFISFY